MFEIKINSLKFLLKEKLKFLIYEIKKNNKNIIYFVISKSICINESVFNGFIIEESN